MELSNANPTIFKVERTKRPITLHHLDDDCYDPFDEEEIFDLIRCINDPEHPMTLEELHVVQLQQIELDDAKSRLCIRFTPTIPHCSMATLIGLCIRVRLLRCLPRRYKVDVFIQPGTHQSEQSVNKQLNDKERVAAALENRHLLQVVNQCLAKAEIEALKDWKEEAPLLL